MRTNRGFKLVPSQDPDLDTGPFQVGNRVRYAILKLVLDGGRTKEAQVVLELGRDFCNAFFTIV